MEDVLRNMALFLLGDFCRANNIKMSGTYCVKDGRGFRYKLVRQDTGEKVAGIEFTKHSVPRYSLC